MVVASSARELWSFGGLLVGRGTSPGRFSHGLCEWPATECCTSHPLAVWTKCSWSTVRGHRRGHPSLRNVLKIQNSLIPLRFPEREMNGRFGRGSDALPYGPRIGSAGRGARSLTGPELRPAIVPPPSDAGPRTRRRCPAMDAAGLAFRARGLSRLGSSPKPIARQVVRFRHSPPLATRSESECRNHKDH